MCERERECVCMSVSVSVFEHTIFTIPSLGKILQYALVIAFNIPLLLHWIHISLTKMCAYEALFDCRSHHERTSAHTYANARARALKYQCHRRCHHIITSLRHCFFSFSRSLARCLNNAKPISNVWRSQCWRSHWYSAARGFHAHQRHHI